MDTMEGHMNDAWLSRHWKARHKRAYNKWRRKSLVEVDEDEIWSRCTPLFRAETSQGIRCPLRWMAPQFKKNLFQFYKLISWILNT